MPPVHRDLKPQNVKLTPEGQVKVLDFGLAKAMDPTAAASGPQSGSELAASPTLTIGQTVQGVILGTAAYMSPEQAKGAAVDKRADIWAFGVVLFEMLTGQRLFEADTAPETLAGVLKSTIDLEALPPDTPPALRRLLRRCLERDPRNRLRDIGDARIALRELRDESPPGELPETPKARLPGWTLPVVALAALALAGAAFFLGRRTSATGGAAGSWSSDGFTHFTRLTNQAGLESSPALSPDGEFVAYVAFGGDDRDVFLLRVGGQKPINLTEDSPADEEHPAFSPDGRSIAFRSERDGGGLFVMGATGESVRRLTDFGDNPSWSPDGREIVFSTEGRSDPTVREKESELWVVASDGGDPRRIFAGDAVQPAWSPGGHRITFWAVDMGEGIRDVWTIAADGTDPRRVTGEPSVDWDPIWSPDGSFLYFVSDRSGVTQPWRVAIDETTGRLLGDPEPILLPTSWSGQLTLSPASDRLAFRTSEKTAEIRRLPFDPAEAQVTGPAERLFDTTIAAIGLDLTEDGLMIFRTLDTPEDLYVMRADGTALRKLTDDAAKDRSPVWSPDGETAAFYSNRGGRYQIWTVDRDGSDLRPRTRIEGASGGLYSPTWSPDGRSLVAALDPDLVRFPLQGEPVSPSDFERLPVDRGDAASVNANSWSPDGRQLSGILIGNNGQLLGGLLLYDLSTGQTRFLPVDLPIPPPAPVYPTISWQSDSRRGIVRWGDRLLLVDTETERISTLAEGFHRDGGIARLSADGRWIYMLDAIEEGDVWVASRRPKGPTVGTASEAGSR